MSRALPQAVVSNLYLSLASPLPQPPSQLWLLCCVAKSAFLPRFLPLPHRNPGWPRTGLAGSLVLQCQPQARAGGGGARPASSRQVSGRTLESALSENQDANLFRCLGCTNIKLVNYWLNIEYFLRDYSKRLLTTSFLTEVIPAFLQNAPPPRALKSNKLHDKMCTTEGNAAPCWEITMIYVSYL